MTLQVTVRLMHFLGVANLNFKEFCWPFWVMTDCLGILFLGSHFELLQKF